MGYEHSPRGQSQGGGNYGQYGQGGGMGQFGQSSGDYGSRSSFGQEYHRAMRHEPQGGYDTGFASGSSYGQQGMSSGSSYGQQGSEQGGWLQSLRGKGPKGYTRSDERLKEDICERLTHHPAIDASEVEIEAKQGVVTLSGSVTQRQSKHQIEDLVENVSGVKDIENRITVRSQSQSQQQAGSGSLGGSTSGSSSGKSGQTASSGSASSSQSGSESKPRH